MKKIIFILLIFAASHIHAQTNPILNKVYGLTLPDNTYIVINTVDSANIDSWANPGVQVKQFKTKAKYNYYKQNGGKLPDFECWKEFGYGLDSLRRELDTMNFNYKQNWGVTQNIMNAKYRALRKQYFQTATYN